MSAGRWTLAATALLVAGACTGDPDPAVHALALDTGWEFRRVPSGGDSSWPVDTVWHTATVPGTVHTDLLADGLIDDPYRRDNEARLQWIEDATWSYRTTLSVDPALLEHDRLALVFDGLDTYAEVRLDGVPVLDADNMFRSWRVPVRQRLRAGENELSITFRPAVGTALPIREAHGIPLPMGNDRHDPPTRSFTRKAAYHYGWDWGARFVTSGIWRPVRLEAWSGVRIVDVHWVQEEVDTERARLRADVTVEAVEPGSARVALAFEGEGGDPVSTADTTLEGC